MIFAVPRISTSQRLELGRRLKHADSPLEEDLTMLSEVIRDAGDVLVQAEDQIRPIVEAFSRETSIELNVSSRPKTNGTIIEKLKRSPQASLKTMQDLAGI